MNDGTSKWRESPPDGFILCLEVAGLVEERCDWSHSRGRSRWGGGGGGGGGGAGGAGVAGGGVAGGAARFANHHARILKRHSYRFGRDEVDRMGAGW